MVPPGRRPEALAPARARADVCCLRHHAPGCGPCPPPFVVAGRLQVRMGGLLYCMHRPLQWPPSSGNNMTRSVELWGRRLRRLGLTLVAALLPLAAVHAAEGMWTLDKLPAKDLQARYGFTPDAAWVQHAQRSSLRLAGGCSGSFVSPDGLVLTNHHCVRECVQQLSTAKKNFVADGFYAKEQKDEVLCPTIELNRLDQISDVTARVKNATAGLQGAAFSKAQKG